MDYSADRRGDWGLAIMERTRLPRVTSRRIKDQRSMGFRSAVQRWCSSQTQDAIRTYQWVVGRQLRSL